jgi:ankyrin repeat protein
MAGRKSSAVKCVYPTIVAALIAAGADCNEQIRQDGSPLIAACSGGYAESACLLIEHGADLKRDGLEALDAASRNGHADVIDTLLSKGISVDKQVLGECLSSAYSHPEAMKKLISAGTDLNAKCTCPGGRTALMIAAINGCPETVDLLVCAGADLNAKDDKGHTVLDLMLANIRVDWTPRSQAEKARLSGIVDTLRKSGAKESGLYVEWPEPR